MDKHNAWQREFTLLLKLFSQWLKSRALRSDGLLEGVARLHHMANRQPAPVALLASDPALRLRTVHALCLQASLKANTLAPADLAWSGLRIWTFDVTRPISVRICTGPADESGPAQHSDVANSLGEQQFLPIAGDTSAIGQALDKARAYVEAQTSETGSNLKPRSLDHAHRQSAVPGSLQPRPIDWHCHINLHQPAFHNELTIYECPVKRLGGSELRQIKQLTQDTTHFLWLVDATNFKPELETMVFYAVMSEGLKKGKSLWLAVYRTGSTPANQGKKNEATTIDPEVKEWVLGLGLAPAQLVGLTDNLDDSLDVGAIADLLHKNLVTARRTRWRTEMHAQIVHLQQQVLTQLEAKEDAFRLEQEKTDDQIKYRKALQEQARQDALVSSKQLLDQSRALEAVRSAQIKLRDKVWATLDKADETFRQSGPRAVAHANNNPEQLKAWLMACLDSAQQNLESVHTLLRVGASVLAPELEKYCPLHSKKTLLETLPDVRQQIQRLMQHRHRITEKAIPWKSLTMPVAYEHVRLTQIALDSVVEGVRGLATQWFTRVLAAIDAPLQANAQKQAVAAQILAQEASPIEPHLEPTTTEKKALLESHKRKLEEQIALLNAAVMDALPLAANAVPGSKVLWGNDRPAGKTSTEFRSDRIATA
jgi:hypothetical protein